MSKKIPGIEILVASAIRQLRANQGSTTKEIINYLGQQCGFAGPDFKRAVQLAIKCGLNYGIIQRSKRGFVTCDKSHIPQPIEPVDGIECVGCKRSSCFGGGRSRGRKGSGKSRRHSSRSRRSSRRSHKGARSMKRHCGGKSAKRRGHSAKKRSCRGRKAAVMPLVVPKTRRERRAARNASSSSSSDRVKTKTTSGEEKSTTKPNANTTRPRSTSKGPSTNENPQQ